MLKRRPKGYTGINHMARGHDLIAVLKSVHVPEVTLGPELAARLKKVTPDEWYPIAELLDLLEQLDAKLGAFHLRQVGWTIWQKVPSEAKAQFTGAQDLLNAFDRTYRLNNKGTGIGGWALTVFEPGRAVIEKTTPHHCGMEQGILEESLRQLGLQARVVQTVCFRNGGDLCRYLVTTNCNDERWFGKGTPLG